MHNYFAHADTLDIYYRVLHCYSKLVLSSILVKYGETESVTSTIFIIPHRTGLEAAQFHASLYVSMEINFWSQREGVHRHRARVASYGHPLQTHFHTSISASIRFFYWHFHTSIGASILPSRFHTSIRLTACTTFCLCATIACLQVFARYCLLPYQISYKVAVDREKPNIAHPPESIQKNMLK